MASQYYGLNRGQTEFNVVDQNSTNSTDIEVRIDMTKGWTMSELQTALKVYLADAILKNADAALPVT